MNGNSLKFHPSKIIALSLVVLFATNVKAQYWNGSTTVQTTTSSPVTISNGLNVSGSTHIGSIPSSITDLLTVGGVLRLYDPSDNFRDIRGYSTLGGINILSGSDGSATGIRLFATNNATNPGQLQFISASNGVVPAVLFHNYSGGVYHSLLQIASSGNASFGNMVPTANERLAIEGDINLFNAADGSRNIRCYSTSGDLNIESGSNSTDGPYITLHARAESSAGKEGSIDLVGNGTAGPGIVMWNYNTTNTWTAQMQITPAGQVIIGKELISPSYPIPNMGSNPGNYNLYVSKGILTEKVKVAISSTGDWSDRVFNNSYTLQPLEKVETYVKENRHLPDVPSADEVVKDGVDIGKMDAKFLQKIEELTLYAIEQNKKIELLQKEICDLKKKQGR